MSSRVALVLVPVLALMISGCATAMNIASGNWALSGVTGACVLVNIVLLIRNLWDTK